MELERFIRDVPDFPKKGIIFKDITPLLASHEAFDETVNRLVAPYAGKGIKTVIGIESRGFFFASAVARQLKCGFAPLRKKGKLPYRTARKTYALEYGSDTIEMHVDAVQPGDKVLLLDDVLATGGTMQAACELVEELGGDIVGVAFVIELAFLNGRQRLTGYDLHSLIRVT